MYSMVGATGLFKAIHCKNLRVVLTFMVIPVAHSINILSVIGMFLLLWPHNCLLMRYTWWLSIPY